MNLSLNAAGNLMPPSFGSGNPSARWLPDDVELFRPAQTELRIAWLHVTTYSEVFDEDPLLQDVRAKQPRSSKEEPVDSIRISTIESRIVYTLTRASQLIAYIGAVFASASLAFLALSDTHTLAPLSHALLGSTIIFGAVAVAGFFVSHRLRKAWQAKLAPLE